MLLAKLRNRTCQGLDRQGQGQGLTSLPSALSALSGAARDRNNVEQTLLDSTLDMCSVVYTRTPLPRTVLMHCHLRI